jgi:hypothetical protein
MALPGVWQKASACRARSASCRRPVLAVRVRPSLCLGPLSLCDSPRLFQFFRSRHAAMETLEDICGGVDLQPRQFCLTVEVCSIPSAQPRERLRCAQNLGHLRPQSFEARYERPLRPGSTIHHDLHRSTESCPNATPVDRGVLPGPRS